MCATWFYPSDQRSNDLHSVQEYVAVRYKVVELNYFTRKRSIRFQNQSHFFYNLSTGLPCFNTTMGDIDQKYP